MDLDGDGRLQLSELKAFLRAPHKQSRSHRPTVPRRPRPRGKNAGQTRLRSQTARAQMPRSTTPQDDAKILPTRPHTSRTVQRASQQGGVILSKRHFQRLKIMKKIQRPRPPTRKQWQVTTTGNGGMYPARQFEEIKEAHDQLFWKLPLPGTSGMGKPKPTQRNIESNRQTAVLTSSTPRGM